MSLFWSLYRWNCWFNKLAALLRSFWPWVKSHCLTQVTEICIFLQNYWFFGVARVNMLLGARALLQVSCTYLTNYHNTLSVVCVACDSIHFERVFVFFPLKFHSLEFLQPCTNAEQSLNCSLHKQGQSWWETGEAWDCNCQRSVYVCVCVCDEVWEKWDAAMCIKCSMTHSFLESGKDKETNRFSKTKMRNNWHSAVHHKPLHISFRLFPHMSASDTITQGWLWHTVWSPH